MTQGDGGCTSQCSVLFELGVVLRPQGRAFSGLSLQVCETCLNLPARKQMGILLPTSSGTCSLGVNLGLARGCSLLGSSAPPRQGEAHLVWV